MENIYFDVKTTSSHINESSDMVVALTCVLPLLMYKIDNPYIWSILQLSILALILYLIRMTSVLATFRKVLEPVSFYCSADIRLVLIYLNEIKL